MKEKRAVLVKTYHIIEVNEEELVKEDGLLDNVMKEVSQDWNISMEENVFMKWEGTSMVPLLPELSNCGKCFSCGTWTTDREKEEPIEGLANGAVVNGNLLCDQCLPQDHTWAFK